jgi:hypothetical protein
MGERRPSQAFGIVGLIIGLMANSVTAYAALSLLAEPDGARIRPMGEAVMFFFGALIGLCGAVFSFQAVRQEGTRWAGVIGLIMGLSSFPLGFFLTKYVIGLRHLVFLP